MTKECKWVIKEASDAEKVERLSTEVGIDKVLADLLVKRGIETFEQSRAFFRPDLSNLHDPFLMRDMDKAVERLHEAIVNNEKIMVYGDYDVDGTTAVALLYCFITKFSKNVDFYIPDRYNEGYGVSTKGIEYARQTGVNLIITVDCGIKAVNKVDLANSFGIDVIVCDHHLPDEILPNAVAVLDPKREDCHYPFDDLSGCGVGFKLAQAYSAKYGIDFEELKPLLDLLVVSIASDLVSMVDENRVLAYYGLKILNENPRKGLAAMIQICAPLEPGHVTIDDIVFKIGPRINAAGRIDTGRLAVQLLTAQDAKEAMKIGEQINKNNNERKSIDREITQEALEMVEGGGALASKNTTIVYNPKWNKGVVGIVASRLVEAFYKPTVVLTKSNGFVTGSARSIQGFDLYSAIESCADLLENFGGHMYAAGLTMKEENVDEFARRMDEFVDGKINDQLLTPVVEIDAKINLNQITPKFFRILKQFQPFGPGNTNPVFMTEEAYDEGKGKRVGAGGKHLKLDLIQQDYSVTIPAIAFNMDEYFEYIRKGNPFDVCYSLVENYFRGNSNIQIRIKDIKERHEEII